MRKCILAGALIAVCTSAPASAQDAHFWSQHYATRGVLMGGAVIGSADDLGASFYNPGLMAWVNQRELLLGSNVYEYLARRLHQRGWARHQYSCWRCYGKTSNATDFDANFAANQLEAQHGVGVYFIQVR